MYVRPPNSDEGYIVHRAYLNNTHMQGNPYSFLVYSTQEKIFDISKIGVIDMMSLYLYQEQDFLQ
jgi:hypothetical protein